MEILELKPIDKLALLIAHRGGCNDDVHIGSDDGVFVVFGGFGGRRRLGERGAADEEYRSLPHTFSVTHCYDLSSLPIDQRCAAQVSLLHPEIRRLPSAIPAD